MLTAYGLLNLEKHPLQVVQNREKSVYSICFHPLETAELIIPLNIL